LSPSLRVKIFGLSAGLLAILIAVLLVTMRFQHQVHGEVVGITDYHIPIGALVSELDDKAYAYELELYRLLRLDEPVPAAIDAVERSGRDLLAAMAADLDRIDRLLKAGVGDERNDLADRMVLAKLAGMMELLRRETTPFAEDGARVLGATRRGGTIEARALLAEFESHTLLLQPAINRIRQQIEALTLAATTRSSQHQQSILNFSLLAFIIASVLGLGIAGLIATRLVVGLRRLVAGARAVEAGTFDPLPVTTGDEVGQLTTAFNRMVGELQTKETIRDTFGKFVDPRIVARLIATTGEAPATAERRLATVFFSDIAGFSSISEQLTASVIANFLNRWFTLSTEAIRAHNGVVDKYMGDSVMAFWSAPFSSGDSHAADACLAALAQQQAAAVLHGELPQLLGLRRDIPELKIRMSIATGEVIVGTIGSEMARSFTVIGDIVNLASRLEGINKAYGTRILIAEDTYRLAQAVVAAREIDLITVAGKTEPVRVFELLGRAGALDPVLEAGYRRFAEALAAYRAGDWTAAEAGFREVDASLPGGDAPSRLFVERVAELRRRPPGGWDGVWHYTTK
jgi:adenylate cyclase